MIPAKKNPKLPVQDPLKMNAFFVLSRAEHPRMWRRVLRMRPFFRSSQVAAFERVCSPVSHAHEFESLGRLEHRKFIRRVPAYLRAARTCLKNLKECDLCYVFSLDLLFMLVLVNFIASTRTSFVYEVADIHPLLSANTFRSRLIRLLERMLLRRCCVVVLTSSAFRSEYFEKIQGIVDFASVVIEHKVDLPRSVRERVSFRRISKLKLVIGYFGLIKSSASFDFLVQLAAEAGGRIAVNFYGTFVRPLESDKCIGTIESSPNMTYYGRYNSPRDLEKIYTSVDIVWDSYFEGDNAKWQRTTRFSEACYFKRPIIYNPNTEDGRIAEKYNLGIPMSFNDFNTLFQRVINVTEGDLWKWYCAMENLPYSHLYYENEYDQLIQEILESSFPTSSD